MASDLGVYPFRAGLRLGQKVSDFRDAALNACGASGLAIDGPQSGDPASLGGWASLDADAAAGLNTPTPTRTATNPNT